MITLSDRELAVSLIRKAIQNGARQLKACQELSISERTYRRWKSTLTPMADQRPLAKSPEPANKLSLEERLEVCNIS